MQFERKVIFIPIIYVIDPLLSAFVFLIFTFHRYNMIHRIPLSSQFITRYTSKLIYRLFVIIRFLISSSIAYTENPSQEYILLLFSGQFKRDLLPPPPSILLPSPRLAPTSSTTRLFSRNTSFSQGYGFSVTLTFCPWRTRIVIVVSSSSRKKVPQHQSLHGAVIRSSVKFG